VGDFFAVLFLSIPYVHPRRQGLRAIICLRHQRGRQHPVYQRLQTSTSGENTPGPHIFRFNPRSGREEWQSTMISLSSRCNGMQPKIVVSAINLSV